MISRVLHNPLNGRFTVIDAMRRRSYEDAESQKDSNYWSVTENNSNNAWNLNFNTGNVNNNNKYNSNVVRPVAACGGFSVFYDSVVTAYKDCLRGKMSSTQAVAYMQIAHDDLPVLARELWDGTYHPTTSTCFLVKYPKLREVFAANFRDRIVHHWVCLRLEPLFEERFIAQGNVSFNCRKGFGTDACIRHSADGMKRVSEGFRKPAWVFKGDLTGFFMSIDKGILWYLLERFIKRWRKRYQREGWQRISSDILHRLRMKKGMPEMYWDILLATVQKIVMHHPERDCVLNSPFPMWSGLVPNKSLFGCGEEKGEPIGNLTTQLFANFLMSFFDEYMLFVYRRKNFSYERFVDDWCVICDDKPFLLKTIPMMEAFLRDKLRLEMHKDKRYLQPVSHGMSFVGTYIKPNRLYLSNRTLARFEERAIGFGRLIADKPELTILDCKRIEQVINSYLGFCKGKKTYAKRKEIIESMGVGLFRYFYIRGRYESIRALRKYRELELPCN